MDKLMINQRLLFCPSYKAVSFVCATVGRRNLPFRKDRLVYQAVSASTTETQIFLNKSSDFLDIIGPELP